jgi:hypothetical protein
LSVRRRADRRAGGLLPLVQNVHDLSGARAHGAPRDTARGTERTRGVRRAGAHSMFYKIKRAIFNAYEKLVRVDAKVQAQPAHKKINEKIDKDFGKFVK